MRSFCLVTALLLFVSCAPRDDERIGDSGRGPNLNLTADDFGLIEAPGERLSTCDEENDWSSIRLYSDTSFLFNKIGSIEVVVNNRAKNCVSVSKDNAYQIETQAEDGQWNKSGHFYLVTGIELLKKSDFLSDTTRVLEIARKAEMTEDQLRTFLNSFDAPEMNITYLKPAGDVVATPDKEEFVLWEGIQLKTQVEGTKLPSCTMEADKSWTTVRLPFEVHTNDLDDKELKLIVGRGSENCLKVSMEETVELELQKEVDSNDYTKTGEHYLVSGLEMWNTREFLAETELVVAAAASMRLSVEQLETFLNADDSPGVITLTFLAKSEKKEKKQGYSNQFFSIPEDAGKQVHDCRGGEEKWEQMRIFPEVEGLVKSAVENKTLTTLVSRGVKNCLVLGEEAVFTFQKPKSDPSEKTQWVDSTEKFKVVSITIRDKSYYLDDPIIMGIVGGEMGLGLKDFASVLDGINEERINATRIEWVQ